MSFVCLLSFVFTTQIEFSECCVWFQRLTQWCCSCISNFVACWNEKKVLLMDVFWCAFFLLSSPHRLSFVSIVFDFSDSLNDVAPVTPMLLTVFLKRKGRVNCWWTSFVCLLSFVFTTQIESCEFCVWFQWFTQWCCSCVSNTVVCWCEEKEKSELLKDVFCVSSFFCLHSPDWVLWVLCLTSMIHSMVLLLFL